MNRNDDRDIYRTGANGIGSSYGESQGSSFDEERFGRERSRGESFQGSSGYGQRSYEGNRSYGGQGSFGQGSPFGRDYRDYPYGRDYGMSRDYGRDYERDQGYYGRDYGIGRDRDDAWSGRDRDRGWFNRDYERPGFRGRDENEDFWGRPRQHEGRSIGERIGDFFRGDDRERERYQTQQWDRHRQDEPGLWDKVKGAFTGKGPKGYTRSDDRIREDVCERLTYHPYVDASDIEVLVRDGEVTLTGSVDDRNSKRLAEDIVEDIRGVRDVHNQIRVKSQLGVGSIGQTQTSGTTPGLSGSSSSSIGTSGGNKR
jgi:hypothetical protein